MNDQRREGRLLCKLSLKIDVNGPGGCWLWTGRRHCRGYGTVDYRQKSCFVHKILYEIFVSPVPAGMQLDHLCRVTRCVNPAHLEPVTPRENIMRSSGITALNAVKTRCLRGHPLSGDNVFLLNGHRVCRACRRIYNNDIYARRYSSAVNGGTCYVTLKKRGVVKGTGRRGRPKGGA